MERKVALEGKIHKLHNKTFSFERAALKKTQTTIAAHWVKRTKMAKKQEKKEQFVPERE
jgi:hypothetical protein